MAAALAVVGRYEGTVRSEDVGDNGIDMRHEGLGNDRDVVDGLFGETEGGVVVVNACMLDEKQRRAYLVIRTVHFQLSTLHRLADDITVEEGLEVVVAMVFQTLWVEDGIDISERLQTAAACLVVDDADALLAVGGGDQVEAVDGATDGYLRASRGHTVRHLDEIFEAEDGEGRQPAVDLEELMEVTDDDFTVDDLKTVEFKGFQFFMDGIVDSTVDVDLVVEYAVDGYTANGRQDGKCFRRFGCR